MSAPEVRKRTCARHSGNWPRSMMGSARSCWSGRKDLNLRPLRPERSALPGCATPRPGGCFGKESRLSYIRGSKRKPCASATPRQVTLP